MAPFQDIHPVCRKGAVFIAFQHEKMTFQYKYGTKTMTFQYNSGFKNMTFQNTVFISFKSKI